MNGNHALRRQHETVAGVCGGPGAFFGVSPFWFRLLSLILMIPGGALGVAPYPLLWVATPRKRRGWAAFPA